MTRYTQGVLCAIAAYLLWGVLAVYWKLLREVSPFEILAHRVLWSFLFLSLLVIWRTEWPTLRKAFGSGRTVRLYGIAALLLGLNWGLYIWAVNSDQLVEASLGYYINPLVNVLLGVGFLRERLRSRQWLAILLAFAGVGQLTYAFGRPPWVALILAASFGLYGLTKKLSPLSPVPGLTLETVMLVPIAFGYLSWREYSGKAVFLETSWTTTGLLIFAGVVTSLPLLLFARAAQAVKLSSLGLLQYISPSCGLLLGVLAYGEPFPARRIVGFVVIWCALAAYWLEGMHHQRRERSA